MTRLGRLAQIARKVPSRARARARAFWRDQLGIAALFAFPKLALFDLGGTRLMLSATKTRDGGDSLYLHSADIAGDHAALAARGVTFTHLPQVMHTHPDGTEEWMSFFIEDEGRPPALAAQIKNGQASNRAAGLSD